MPGLKIYKASAGSGKTFSLVHEYLSVLILNPSEYKHILAVTFTNDATEEMKNRVLRDLDILYRTPQLSGHLPKLMEKLQKDESYIKNRAGEALRLILHDYSNFNITTIDSFFQKILRAFAKDIGLPAAYNLELNSENAILEVVENIVATTSPDKSHSKWLLKAATDKIEEGKNWNIREELKLLFQETLKENFQLSEESIIGSYRDEDQIETLQSETQKIISSFEQTIQELAAECDKILIDHGLTKTDFKGKSSSFYNWIDKLKKREYEYPNQTFLNALDNADGWFTKTTDKGTILKITNAYNSGLNEALNKIKDYYLEQISAFNSALLVRSNLSYFALFESLQKELYHFKEENDLLFISDTNQFINQIIGGNGSEMGNEESFIFEKVGSHFHHFLIDEFQDTSQLQWRNFKPLLNNAISQDYLAMVVGDVKQSIYKFRNGDWRLLHEQAEREITWSENIHLDANYRSLDTIIKFNNALFDLAPRVTALVYQSGLEEFNDWTSKFIECYQDHFQNTSTKSQPGEGFVKVKLFSKNEDVEEVMINSRDQKLQELLNDLNNALERGYAPGDISILVFRKTEAQIIASYLQDCLEKSLVYRPLKVVTQSALNISYAHSVKVIVSALHYLHNPKDNIALYNIKSEYQLYIQNIESVQEFSTEVNTKIDGIKTQIKKLISLPILILVQELITYFQLDKKSSEAIFIQNFKDAAFDFLNQYPDDLTSFLEWWEENKLKYNIEIAKSKDSLQIQTIHKSTGLEFDIVFIPFAEWDFDSSGSRADLLWLQYNTGETLTLPVRYDKKMLESHFKNEYLKNKFYNYLDRLNLLYVATTRAVRELYIYSEDIKTFDNTSPKNGNIKSIFNYLFKSVYEVSDSNYCIPLNQHIQNNEIIIGSKTASINQHEQTDLISLQSPPIGSNIFDTISFRTQAIDFRDTNESLEEEKRNNGILFHEIIANSNNIEEAEQFLTGLLKKRRVNSSQHELLLTDLRNLFNNPQIIEWHQSYKSYSEYSFNINNQIFKPDKVFIGEKEAIVLDFKTGKYSDSYYKQVVEYVNVVSQVFGLETKGYIYFTQSETLQHISDL